MRLAVVKLGGSVITRKSTPFDVNLRLVELLGSSLSRALRASCIDKLVVVHGGGSFGHFVVFEHGGLRSEDAFVQTVFFMRELNQIVVDVLTMVGVKAVGIDTHAIAYMEGSRPRISMELLVKLLERNLVPVVYGDAVIAVDGGYSVLSGDDIAWEVASTLRAYRLIFVTSVPGVYIGGEVAREVSLSRDIERIDALSSGATDVTGGMKAKLIKGKGRVGSIGAVYIVGPEPRALYEALCSEPSIGTRVVE